MPKNGSAPPTVRSAAALTVFRLAALFTFLAVGMGAVVCATSSGASCPTWPGCRPGQIAPQWQLSPVIEFTHRVVAMASGPLVLAAAVMSARLPGSTRWVRILPRVALVGALAAGAFGRFAVLSGLPTWVGAVDLFCALTAMTAMGVAAIMLDVPAPHPRAASPATLREVVPSRRDRTLQRATSTRWHYLAGASGASVAVLVAMHVSGIFAAGAHSYTRCMGWPIWRLVARDLHPRLQDARLGLAGLGAVLVVTTVVMAARTDRLRRWAVVLATLFAAEMALRLVIRAHELDVAVAAAYSVLAVALLWGLGLLTAVAGRGTDGRRDRPDAVDVNEVLAA